ncbi:MAG: TraI domain-containing protein [Phycisphaerae bacterium]
MPSDPPPRKSIRELQAGDRVDDQIFLLTQKDLRTTNSGGMYMHAVLADASGQLVARMWNANQQHYDSLPDSGLIHVTGRVENYKNQRQFIIDATRVAADDGANPADFLPRTRHDIEQMWSRVKEILRGIRNSYLRNLVAKFINDDAFAAAFKLAPAARTNHHAFVGGLLEHTLNLLELAVLVLPRYPEVSADLVLAGLFLHDAGKTRELSFRTNFDYTSEGQLLGHIVLATMWVQEKARLLERESNTAFPPEILFALQHILVAHHGKYEFGSPRLPATPEAIMVHYLDNLDAKLNMMLTAINADADAASDWTPWIAALETRVFKPDVLRPPTG